MYIDIEMCVYVNIWVSAKGKLTFAVQISLIRKAVRAALAALHVDGCLVAGVDLIELGVCMP